jgi:hypothetical protein
MERGNTVTQTIIPWGLPSCTTTRRSSGLNNSLIIVTLEEILGKVLGKTSIPPRR